MLWVYNTIDILIKVWLNGGLNNKWDNLALIYVRELCH